MRDKYYELTITLRDNFVEFLADFITNIAGNGVEIGKGKIIVRSENSVNYIKDAVESLINSLGKPIKVDYKIEKKSNEDWILKYQNSIEPIEVGKFYIHPSWHEKKDGKINIKIDPALAFGSGHHTTTFSCLEAISKFVKSGDRVLDVGCGSGILGLAAKKLGAKVELCDTDPISVDSCAKNFALNGVEYDELWEGSANMAKGKYNIIIANIIADVLRTIDKDLKRVLKEDGILILSGILDTKEDSVAKLYSDLKLIERKVKDEWVTLIYKKV